ncbi:MAG: putative colanic acid biosynthesis UDP-glucose lipid carrier transferase, partial [Arenicella sp.]
LILSPLLAVTSVIIKLESPGPVFFKQRRYGLDGQEILVWKFRSMSVCEDGNNVIQAVANDARVTRFGSFIRKYSIDELPQLINVLNGTMSLVGPRPHAVAHNEYYRDKVHGYMGRHKIRPGITGWAQINGCRGETEAIETMQRRIRYDLEYIQNWSIALDIRILLKTLYTVLRDRNAY